MNNKPLLSIAIATKNREKYCIQVIKTLLKYEYNFELVVQDNSDSLDLKNEIKSQINDNRLVYNYTPPPFSSIDNFNAVLELCTGKYVCLIGDDDSVLENIFEVVKWADENNIDSVCPKTFVNYLWPNNDTGRILFPKAREYRLFTKPKENLQKLINDGIILYSKYDLPKFYHGIIKKSCFDLNKSKVGYYIGGLSPDIYSAVSLANVVTKHVVIDFPITIAGACPKSTTVDNIKGEHSGDLKNAPHFRNREHYIWSKEVPEFYSVQTIWADSAIHAFKEHNINVNLEKLNLTKMLAAAIVDNNNFKEYFIKKTNEIVPKKIRVLNLKKLKYQVKAEILLSKISFFLGFGYKIKTSKIYDVEDIEKCTEVCNEIIRKLK